MNEKQTEMHVVIFAYAALTVFCVLFKAEYYKFPKNVNHFTPYS